MNPRLESALAAAKRGWHILPVYNALPDGTCACKNDMCVSIGKHPLTELVPNGQTQATTDPTTIRDWWTRFPSANVAVVMVPSGLIAFDVDLYKGDADRLGKLIVQYGNLPSTTEQISGSAQGVHLIFKAPGYPIRGQIGDITLRGRNYIVIAPSTHKSGNSYKWEEGCGPDEIAAAELPPAWKEAIRKPDAIGEVGLIPEDQEPDWLRDISQDERVQAMKNHLAKEPGEVMGQSRPGMMFDIARTAARGFAIRDPNAVYEALKEVNDKSSPPYPLDKLAERVYAAYEKAHTPAWGENCEGIAILRMTKSAAITTTFAPVTKEAILSKLKATRDGYNRASGNSDEAALKRHKGSTLSKVINHKLGQEQVSDPNEVIFTIKTVVEESPAHSPAGMIAEILANVFEGATMDSIVRLVQDAQAELPPDMTSPAPNTPISDDQVKSVLVRSEKGGVKPTGSNIEIIFRFANDLRDKLRWNEIKRNIEVTGGRFERHAKIGHLDTALSNWLETEWGITAGYEMIGKQLGCVAMYYNSYDPVADYLKGLKWDGTPRIDNWLTTYCKVKPSEYVRKIGARWLISGAARGLDPGCKVDTVLILKGNQGFKKSTAFDILGGDFFSDSPLDLANKDARISASTTWIIELAELAALGQRDLESNKAFLSGRRDKVRPPYGKADVEFQRHCIFAGTTNAEEFLIDETGNRRYWVAKVTAKIDTDALRRDRDQIWAEAVVRYRAGERWWFDEYEQVIADQEGKKSEMEDPWASVIAAWAERQVNTPTSAALGLPAPVTKHAWSLAEVAKGALDIQVENVMRYARQLSSSLRKAGFVSRRIFVAGKRNRYWIRKVDEHKFDLDDEGDVALA